MTKRWRAEVKTGNETRVCEFDAFDRTCAMSELARMFNDVGSFTVLYLAELWMNGSNQKEGDSE